MDRSEIELIEAADEYYFRSFEGVWEQAKRFMEAYGEQVVMLHIAKEGRFMWLLAIKLAPAGLLGMHDQT